MKFNKKLLQFLILLLLIIPVNVFAYSKYVALGGETIGIEVNSKGVLIVDFYKVNDKYIGKDAGFLVGDIIIALDNENISNIDDLTRKMNNKNGVVKFVVLRNGKEVNINYKIEKDSNGVLKTGLYIKDRINGIGTLSFIIPESRKFGSLGHEIIEKNTLSKFEINNGEIYKANVFDIVKSRNGQAGEKNSTYERDVVYGEVGENEISGIFGEYLDDFSNKELIEVGNLDDIHTGDAYIKTVISDDVVEKFSIDILSIDSESKTKNLLFEVTDKKLLKETGGIVQGMSGSPIIQDNKLIGAVNYVIVNDTSKGYGIFITTMLEECEN